jgi:16S rRNA (guanine527-N7)-methyltransferase
MSGDVRTRAALERVAATHGLDDSQTEALARYVDLLLGWRKANVTGLTDPVAVVDTLVGDSLALLAVPALKTRETGTWLDLGAGAGIPGIPLAVALPGVRITLLDAVAKKCAFLEEAVRAAGLEDRATVTCARSEQHAAEGAPGREAYDVVLARAVSELAVVIELAAPLLAEDGLLLASKTRRALREEQGAAEVAAERCGLAAEAPLPLNASPLDAAVCAVYRKVAPAPDWLPRREGMATKRPLGS